MKPDFVEFPKIARLSRNCVITEKIDGTNASIFIRCTVCGEATEFACADCRMELVTTVYVCAKPACRDTHEIRCPDEVQRRLYEANTKLEAAQKALEWIAPRLAENCGDHCRNSCAGCALTDLLAFIRKERA